MKVRQMIQVTTLSVVVAYLTSLFLLPSGISMRCRADGCDPGPEAPEGIAYCNGDANGDKKLDLSDAVSILDYLFLGGPAPVAYAACSHTPEECDDLEFGRCIAGSYILRAADGTADVMTFGAHGSLDVVYSHFDGNPHGTWWITGPREITAVSVSFMKQDGEVAYTIVRTYVIQFDEDCSTQTVDVHGAAHVFPTDPAAAIFPPETPPVFENDNSYTATKIKW